jgi:hypothetical protein
MLVMIERIDFSPSYAEEAEKVEEPTDTRFLDGLKDINGGKGDSIDDLVASGSLSIERDYRETPEGKQSEKPEDQGVVKKALEELMEEDPEFKEAFLAAQKNGLRFNIRFNADGNAADVINGDILQIDIAPDADIKAELKKRFNADSKYETVKPGDGPSFDDVMEDEDMSGKDFVAHMERLGQFSFTGEHADTIRSDVIHMYDNSNYMKQVMRSTLIKNHGEKKFNFSTIGTGGGTISRPFGDFATTVTANGNYDKAGENPEADVGRIVHMAHEMVHSFLDVADAPAMDVAEEIIIQELGGGKTRITSTDAGTQGRSRIAYDDKLKGSMMDLDEDFDVLGFMEASRDGALNKKTHQEILDEFGGGTISLPPINNKEEYKDKLNGLVETIRTGVNVDDRQTLYMEGEIGDRYQQLLEYNIRNNDFKNWQEAHEFTTKEFMGLLNNYKDEADVFNGYLERHGGEEQLKNLAYQTWNSFNDIVVGPEVILTGGDFDGRLNGLVSTIIDGVDVDSRKTLYMEGNLAERYKELLAYNLRNGDFDSYKELSDHTRKQFLDRLRNSPDEADVFEGYLSRHGGNDTLDDLAEEVWTDAGH